MPTFNKDIKVDIDDKWLTNWVHILELFPRNSVALDVGCGSGWDLKYLDSLHFRTIGCDFDTRKVSLSNTNSPNSKIVHCDISQDLPKFFGKVDLIVSSLSLHYFDKITTVRVIKEISKIINKNGNMICRLNATDDFNFGAGSDELIEKNYVKHEGNKKRFFSLSDIEMFFLPFFEIYQINKRYTNKYIEKKSTWEVWMVKNDV